MNPQQVFVIPKSPVVTKHYLICTILFFYLVKVSSNKEGKAKKHKFRKPTHISQVSASSDNRYSDTYDSGNKFGVNDTLTTLGIKVRMSYDLSSDILHCIMSIFRAKPSLMIHNHPLGYKETKNYTLHY